VFDAATPALDQFGEYAFIYEGSSPAHQTGRFYANHRRGLQLDPHSDAAMYPEVLTAQLPAWAPYQDHQRAAELPLVPPEIAYDRPFHLPHGQVRRFPPLIGPIVQYDAQMRQEEQANPRSFAVDRRALWASVVDAFFDANHVNRIFDPMLSMAAEGNLATTYFAHGDPSIRNDNFAWLIGHAEGPDDRGLHHVVVDLIRLWRPDQFAEHEIDFGHVFDEIHEDVLAFNPRQVSFDQFQAFAKVQDLRTKLSRSGLPGHCSVIELPHTRASNWRMADGLRQALGLGQVHCPPHRLLADELRFLREVGGRVDHPGSGPVQTNDIATCLMVVVHQLLGPSSTTAVEGRFSETVLRGMWPSSPNDRALFSELGGGRRRLRRARPGERRYPGGPRQL